MDGIPSVFDFAAEASVVCLGSVSGHPEIGAGSVVSVWRGGDGSATDLSCVADVDGSSSRQGRDWIVCEVDVEGDSDGKD